MTIDEKIEKAIEPLVEMYSKIESDLLCEIASHFLIGEEFENADYYRIKKLEEMGAFNQNTIKYLSKITGATEDKIRGCLQDIGIATIDTPELSKLYKNGTINVDPKKLLNSMPIQAIIDNAYNEISNHFIELSSKIENATREAYLKVVEESYLKVSMGTHSYDEAIRKAIDDLSNDGISVMKYETKDEDGNVIGIRSYDIEGVVRRDALTAARQLSGNLNNQLIEETQCKYVKYSEHLDCRDTHFPWQGTIVKTEDWKSIADYGDVAGIYGINCRHYVEPYFGDNRGNEEKEYTQEECHKAYLLSQKQRYLERGVRSWKRKAEMFKAAEDDEAYKKSKEKVSWWTKRLDNFVNDNDRQRDFAREYVKSKKSNKPSTKKIEDTFLKEKIGFYDDKVGLTLIPKNSIITSTTQIAGKGVSKYFRNARKYAEKYGGNTSDYIKVAGKIESDKYIFDIHFVKNVQTNLEYDFKMSNKKVK